MKNYGQYTKHTILLLSLALAPQLWAQKAQTEQSKLVSYIQEKYTELGQNYPILIMDQDELDLRYAKARAFGLSDEMEVKRSLILKQYIFEKTGVELKDKQAGSLEMYSYALKDSAYAIPIHKTNTKSDYAICAVFPASVNSNLKLETHRILALDTPDSYYPEDIFYRIKKHIPFDILKMYSILHELGHCLDKTFLPSLYRAYEPSGHGVHQSESFAEAFATFMLIKEGYKNWSVQRAYYRNLYSRYMGPWFVNNPRSAFGNPVVLQGGVVYYLAPALTQANYLINRNKDLKDWSIEEYLKQAEDIVLNYDIDQRAFQAIYRTFGEDNEDVLNFYRKFTLDSPELFKKAYEELLGYLDFSPYLERQALWDEAQALPSLLIDQGQPLKPLGPEELAQIHDLFTHYENEPSQENLVALLDTFEDYRSNLTMANNESYQDQLARKVLLDTLWETILAPTEVAEN